MTVSTSNEREMSGSLLETRNVFLDTGAYDHQKLRFDHAALKKLRQLGRSGFLRILLTDAVDGEVRAHICRTIENATAAFGRFQGHAGILESAPSGEFKGLFDPLNVVKMRDAGLAVWDSFLEDAKVERVSAATVDGAELLKLYFSELTPFSSRKKSEFPDAISLLSLDIMARRERAGC